MKRSLVVCLLLVTSIQAFAGEKPSKELALEFLKVRGVDQSITAVVGQYESIKSKNMNSEEKDKLHQNLLKNASWESMKDQLTESVIETYTKEELEVFIEYSRKPEAASLDIKNKEFASKLQKAIQYNVNGIKIK